MMLTFSPARLARMGGFLFLLASLFMLGALSAYAADPIIVSVQKVEVLKLERDVSVVLIATPTIADVAVENDRLVFLFGLEPGETSILILDSEGNEILSAPVVVVPNLGRQVTVNRANVNEEATYSCAPRCAGVATPAGTGSDQQSTGSSAGDTSDVREASAGETTASKLNALADTVEESAESQAKRDEDRADRDKARDEAEGLELDDDSDTSD